MLRGFSFEVALSMTGRRGTGVESRPVRKSPEPALASRLVLAALAALVVISPWPFGSVHPVAVLVISTLALGIVALALGWGAVTDGLERPAVPLWPVLGLLAVGLFQLVPLPTAFHGLVAPGSHAVWHPAEPAAARVLGSAARPITLDPASSLSWLALVGGLVGLAALSAPALRDRGAALRAALVVVAGGLVVSIYGILARARFGSLLYGYIPVPTISPFGPFVSKNHFAGYVGMTALLSLGLAMGLADRGRRRDAGGDWTRDVRTSGGVVLALVSGLAMALAVLVSLSRGGVLSLAAGILVLLALRWTLRRAGRRAGWRRLVPAVVVGLVLGTLLLAVLPREARDRMKSLASARADSSGSFRLDTWRQTLVMARDSPWVGLGMGSFHDAFPRHKRGYGFERVEHAENDYLEMLVEGGLVGLGLALLAALLLIRRAWRGLSAAETDPLLRGLGVGALAGLAALAVHSAVDFELRIPSNALLAVFLAALAAAASGIRPLRAPAAVAVVPLALLAGLWLAPEPARDVADRAIAGAVSAASPEARGLRLAQAEATLSGSLSRRPADAEAWLLLAWTRAAGADARTALALARYAVRLDPERDGLRKAADDFIRALEGTED